MKRKIILKWDDSFYKRDYVVKSFRKQQWHSGLANAVSQILIFSTKLFPNVGSYVSRKPPKAFGFLTFYFRSNRRFSKSRIWVKTQFLPNLHNSISKKIDFSVKMTLFLKKERFAGLDLYTLIYYILIGKKWHITIFLQTVPFWVKRHLVFFSPNLLYKNRLFGEDVAFSQNRTVRWSSLIYSHILHTHRKKMAYYTWSPHRSVLSKAPSSFFFTMFHRVVKGCWLSIKDSGLCVTFD